MLELIKSIPLILQFMFELKKLIESQIAESDRRQKMSELTNALQKARETKDTSELETVLRNITSGS